MTRNRDIATILGLTEADNTDNVSLGAGGGGGGVTVYNNSTAESFLALDSSGYSTGDLAYWPNLEKLGVWRDSDGNWKTLSFDEDALGNVIKANGGTESDAIDGSTTYRLHVFTTSGDFVVNANVNVEYLIIGGGGSGGGMYYNGGGGAGGYRTNVSGATSGGNSSAEGTMTMIPATYSIVIGAGGASVNTQGVSGNQGGDTSFNNIISLGGGAGPAYATTAANGHGIDGGSGGGGGWSNAKGTKLGGSGTTGQGSDGGNGASGNNYYGAGGGGGAGAVGGTGIYKFGGDGGDGLSSSIDLVATFRAGGGGAASPYNSPAGNGSGGSGGGGTGGLYSPATMATDGAINTGGGGGGASHTNSNVSGNGGSGIVIIRYVK